VGSGISPRVGTVQIVVDNRLRMRLEPGVAARLTPLFEHVNSQWARLRSMGYFPGKSEPRVYKTWEEKGGWYSFPRGGMQRVRDVLKEMGVPHSVSDQRTSGTEELDVEYIPPGEVAAYQVEAVDAVTRRENSILRAPTSSRKTSLAMMMIARWKVPALVLVDDTGLAEQWSERAADELGIPESEQGRIYGGEFKIRPFTIGLHASVVSRSRKPEDHKRMTKAFGAVIADECHVMAAARAYESIDIFPARYRVGVSADTQRKDGKEYLIYDLLGSIAYEIDREELVRQGIILDVEIRVVETAFEAPWYGGGDADYDFNRLLDEMQQDDGRNALIADMIAREVAGGEQVVALAHRRDHCRILDAALAARGVRSGFLIGGDDYAAEYDRTKAALKSGEARVGIGTLKAIGQGIDMPSVGVGVLATPVAANRLRFNQARGRFCRKPEGKTRAVLYYCWDGSVYPGHLRNLVSWNPTVTIEQDGVWIPLRESRVWRNVADGRGRKRMSAASFEE
jgi:superfamily II DNA or RNA helicase